MYGLPKDKCELLVMGGDDEEIDKDGTDFRYTWTKTRDDETSDMEWNQSHLSSQKSIRITERDVFRRATFSCLVEYVGK